MVEYGGGGGSEAGKGRHIRSMVVVSSSFYRLR